MWRSDSDRGGGGGGWGGWYYKAIRPVISILRAQGRRNTHSRFMLQESGISSGDMDRLACKVERGTMREVFPQGLTLPGDQMKLEPK